MAASVLQNALANAPHFSIVLRRGAEKARQTALASGFHHAPTQAPQRTAPLILHQPQQHGNEGLILWYAETTQEHFQVLAQLHIQAYHRQ